MRGEIKLAFEYVLSLVPKKELNGLGSKGYGWLVPDTLGLLNFTKAGNIHDAMYYMIGNGTTLFNKRVADETFYLNLKTINKKLSPTKYGYYMRKPVLWLYYKSVCVFGSKFIKRK
jgi:hypothetical protein